MKIDASTSRSPRALVLLAGALVALGAASCKDEKVRVPFTSVLTPTAVVTTATPIFFSVRDKPNQFVTVSMDVSADGGATYVPATPATGSPPQVVIAGAPAGASGFFYWDPIQDLGPGMHREVVVRVSAYGREFGVPGNTAAFTVDLTDRLDPVTSGGDDRYLPVVAALPDDRVWVAGGVDVGGSPRSGGWVYDPATDELTTSDGLRTPRTTPGWALLRGGQVLVAGGSVGGTPSDAAETFDPTTEQATAVPGGLVVARDAPAVAALPDGRAVVIGGAGAGGTPVADVEVFTPGAGGGSFAVAFTAASTARVGATATALPDGRVLVVGGVDAGGTPQTTALLIDAGATSATATDDEVGRAQHAAVLLPDGRVLVAGGTTTALDDASGATTVTSIYDPVSETFSSAGLMNYARHRPGLAYAGGTTTALDDASGATTVTSIYDPVSETFSSAGLMNYARHRPGLAYAGGHVVAFNGAGGTGVSATSDVTAERYDVDANAWVEIAGPSGVSRRDAVAVATGPGRALVVGGGATPEVYTPDAQPTNQAFDPLVDVPSARADHTATLLGEDVLIVGGTDGVTVGRSSVERWTPRTRRFEARASLSRGRSDHAAALTQVGVLVVGGRDDAGLVAQAEVYDNFNDRWTSAGSLSTPRAGATAVVLADGTVLVSGGVDAAGVPVDSQERWSPFTRTFSTFADLSDARADHRAVTYAGAAVVGPGRGAGGPTATVDIAPPPPGAVETVTGDERAGAGLAVPVAAPGFVLVSGGEGTSGLRDDAALLDLRRLSGAAPAFLAQPRPLVHARADHEAVVLRGGAQVLLAGGRGPGGAVRDEGEVFRFTTSIEQGRGERTADRRAVKARVRHTATLLTNGRVLIVGGVDERGVVIAGAEQYVP